MIGKCVARWAVSIIKRIYDRPFKRKKLFVAVLSRTTKNIEILHTYSAVTELKSVNVGVLAGML